MNFSKPDPIKDFPYRYIFDTDTLITYDRFYPADIFKHLSSFMHNICQRKTITICDKTKQELYDGFKHDKLFGKTLLKEFEKANTILSVDLFSGITIKHQIMSTFISASALVQSVVDHFAETYLITHHPYLSSSDIELLAETFMKEADSQLIVWAIVFDLKVVTNETGYLPNKPPSKDRIKIPDICYLLGIPHFNFISWLREQNASI